MANGNAINVGQFDADASCGCPCASCQCNVRCALSVCVCLSVCGCLCGVSDIYSQQFFAYFSIVFNWQRAEFTGPHMQRDYYGRTKAGWLQAQRQRGFSGRQRQLLSISLSLSVSFCPSLAQPYLPALHFN